jgi:hypothetical protein
VKALVAAVLLAVASSTPAFAQVDGHVAVLFDVLPDLADAEGNQSVTELRTRVFVERRQDIGERLRLNLAGYVEALVADRDLAGASGTATDATVRPGDLYAEFRTARFDVRAGYSRIVWGRLDEFQPTDVVNPIDLSRFLLEGRSEARLPVALVRGRAFLPGSSTVEGIVAPVFRAGTFDLLDEQTSPFNLAPLQVRPPEPETTSGNVQGGARFTSTVGRLDWAVSAYRGLRTFAPYERFTMIGGDFEAARGPWGVRGELAVFAEDDAIEGGIGVDRRAGDYRLAANAVVTDRPIEGTDVLLVVSTDRNFARETRRVRVFAVYDPTDDTAFGRVIASTSLRDNVWLEGSAGIFAGESRDTIGRLTRRDFLYARLQVFF